MGPGAIASSTAAAAGAPQAAVALMTRPRSVPEGEAASVNQRDADIQLVHYIFGRAHAA